MIKQTNQRSTLRLKSRPSIDGIVPLPDIDRGLDAARRRADARPIVDGFRAQAASVEVATGRRAMLNAACENGDGRAEGIASFLNPVVDHFGMDQGEVASLAAFTRKLMRGGKPRKGAFASSARNVDLD